MRLFTLFPNLITKESYNWWVTRIFWGFRQQISKAKYLKISQNIGGKYQEASGEHSSTVQNGCSPIQVGGYQMIRIRPSGKVETPTSPIRRHAPDAKYPDVMAAAADFRMWYIRVESGGNRIQWRKPGAMVAAAPSQWNDSILSGYVVWMPSDGVSGHPIRVYSLHGFQATLLNLRLLWWSTSYQNTKT